jgi:sugar/nucleoside kinase (ribokinase family)
VTAPLLVSVGDLMVDVAVAAPALARGGDVAGSVRLGPGGSAANVAAWAAAGRGRARLVAGRGDDLAGRLLAAALAERGIELRPAGPVGAVTGAMLVVTEAGERTFVADPGANLALGEGEVAGAVDGAGAVFVSGYPLLRAPPRRAAMAAAAAALAARVGTVVVKCGPDGVVVHGGPGRPRRVPAPAADPVDVTGAGDAFAAGYLLASAGGADPAEAAAAGTALAALAVATRGAWPDPGPPGR